VEVDGRQRASHDEIAQSSISIDRLRPEAPSIASAYEQLANQKQSKRPSFQRTSIKENCSKSLASESGGLDCMPIQLTMVIVVKKFTFAYLRLQFCAQFVQVHELCAKRTFCSALFSMVVSFEVEKL